METHLQNTKILLEQINNMKSKLISSKRNNKSLKQETMVLRAEQEKTKDENKYENELIKIQNQLTILPVIKEYFEKQTANAKIGLPIHVI